ncbi:hypothetical protein BC826DRAFT_1112138 [Russula brevipes]|nr:hypothetical protein BC826DRAFT_1112138 [Russula brevipes]
MDDDLDDPLDWLSTMAVPYHPTPRTPIHDVSPTTPIGFSPNSYRQVVRSHQIRLREVNEEYRRLQATHESLVETHQNLMSAYTEAIKQPLAQDHNAMERSTPSLVIRPYGALGPMSWLPSLEKNDYPHVKFWTKEEWRKSENFHKDTSELETKGAGRGASRSSKGENVMMLYIEDANGSPISGTLAGEIRDLARSVWRGFYVRGVAPGKWGHVSKDVRDEFCHEMESRFEVLRYCDNHWKTHMLATSIYSQWYRIFDKKNTTNKDENEALLTKKLRIGVDSVNDTQISQHETRTESHTSLSPEVRALEDPLADVFDRPGTTMFPVLDTVPQNIPSLVTRVPCTPDSDVSDTDGWLENDNGPVEANITRLPEAPVRGAVATTLTTQNMDASRDISFISHQPNENEATSDVTSTLAPASCPLIRASTTLSLPAAPEPTEQVDPDAPTDSPATTAPTSKGPSHKKYKHPGRMIPGSAITAR